MSSDPPSRSARHYRETFLTPLLVLTVALLALGFIWRGLDKQHERNLGNHFAGETARISAKMDWRMSAFAQILHGAAGLFTASDDVSRDEWARYVEGQEIDQVYSGVQGLAYARLVPREALAEHVAAIRREGFPDYAVRPAGARAVYSSVVYIEPFSGINLRAFGYDMLTEPVRRAALDLARDTGRVVLSGKVTLVQDASDDAQAGVLAFHAVYAKNSRPKTVDERRAALVGWAVSPYRMNDLIDTMLSDDLALIRLEIFDGLEALPQNLLYDSRRQAPEADSLPPFTVQSLLHLEGRTWTLRYTPLPGFVSATKFQPPWVEFSGILIISLLLFTITWALVNTRRRAAFIASRLTRSLHKSQSRLLASVRDYGDLVTRIPVGIYKLRTFKDGRQQFDYASPRFCSQLQVGAEAVRRDATLAYACIHPDDMPQLRRLSDVALAALAPFVWEGRIVAPAGIRWIHVESLPNLVGDGELVWSGMLYDITERKLGEQALAESETRFRTFFDHNSSVMLLIDPASGVIVAANSAAAAYYGYRPEQLIGMSLSQINTISPEALAGEEQRVLRDECDHFFFTHRLASGELRDVEVYLTPIESDGRPMLFSIVHDITERKQAEAKLRLAATVFSHAREGIFITAADGTIIDVNDAFTEITGYSRAEVLGHNPRLLSSGRHDSDFFSAMWRDLSDKDHWYGEIWNRRKNGDVYAEMLTISAVRDAAGAILHYVALFSDITPFKEHEHELKRIAHYDALTTLPNRVLLADRLRQAMAQTLRRKQRLAVVYLDLDGFKEVNDSYGHDVGDQVLIAAATRMKQALREGDTLARLGGDEFVAVLLDLADARTSIPMLSRLLQAAARPAVIGRRTIQVSASLGATFYPQRDEVEADLLLRQADQAMYQAKTDGKNCYSIFDAGAMQASPSHADERQLAIPLSDHEA